MAYLIHYNQYHDPKTGQFTNGPQMSIRQRQKANKKIYKVVQKIWDKDVSNNRAAEKWASKNVVLRDAAKDEKLQSAYEKLKSVKPNPNLNEPSYWDDEYTIKEATKLFQKDWPDWKGDPTDNKYFGYYMDDVAQTSKTYAKALKDYEEKVKNDPWNKAYNQYWKELERVAKDFAGNLADEPFQGNKYYPYSSVIKYALSEIIDEK